MSPHDVGRRRVEHQGMEEAAHGSLPYSIADPSVDLMHLEARLFLDRAGFNVDSSPTGPERLI
jgi:hypothetical protein